MTFWVAGAVVVGSVAAGAIGAAGAEGAASQQAGAAENAQQISQQEFNTITAQEQPFMQGGYGALSALEYGLGIPNTSPVAYGGYAQPPGTPQAPQAPPGAGGGREGANQRSGMPIGPNGGLIGGPGGPMTGQGILTTSGGITVPPGARPAGGSFMGGSTAGGGGSLSDLNYTMAQNASQDGAPAGPPGSNRIPTPGLTPGPSSSGIGYGSLVQPFTTANWQQLSPAYNFQLQQGQQGVLSGDSANFGSLSGAAAKDLINYNQGTAAGSFGNAFNMFQTQQGNIYSRLSGLAQLGQNAAANTGQQGTALAGQSAQSAQNIGTAQAGGTVGAANALSGSLTGALPWLYANQTPAPTFNQTEPGE